MSEQTFEFRAEIRQLLNILVHSLYKEREIFLRELVSNASDALAQIQFEMLTNENVFEPDAPLEIHVDFDEEAKTLTVSDSGIGMTRDELITNLGTIAHSGAAAFLKSVEEGQKVDVDLIGQFGVGFYSVFMVAEEVVVTSRSYKPDAEAHAWRCSGAGTYRVEPAEREHRGTTVEVKLKEDADEFANKYRLEQIVKRYSDFVSFPVFVKDEQANQQTALWRQRPNEVSDEQYAEFYKHVTHDFQDPLVHTHLAVDSPVQIYSILYIPSQSERGFLALKSDFGLRLYSHKVLIDEHNKDMLPEYLRFVEGVVDSDDIPLNVSRETVQSNAVMRTIQKNLVRKVLNALDDLANEDKEKYTQFWREFAGYIKEGVATDFAHRDKLTALLRFHSSKYSGQDEWTSLPEYVARMPENQEHIYYIFGEDLSSISHSPHLDPFKKRDIEVLYLTEPIDSFMMMNMREFEDKTLKNISEAGVKLPKEEGAEEEVELLAEPDFNRVVGRFVKVLGDRVSQVRESKSLTGSPCRLATPEDAAGADMQRVYKMLKQDMPEIKRVLELNRNHPIIGNLARLMTEQSDAPVVDQSIEQLYESALLLEGIHPNPADMVPRIQELIEEATR